MTKEENLHWLNQEIQTWENECQSKHPIKEALYAAAFSTDSRSIKADAGGQRMSNELFEIFLDMLEEACYDMEQEDE